MNATDRRAPSARRPSPLSDARRREVRFFLDYYFALAMKKNETRPAYRGDVLPNPIDEDTTYHHGPASIDPDPWDDAELDPVFALAADPAAQVSLTDDPTVGADGDYTPCNCDDDHAGFCQCDTFVPPEPLATLTTTPEALIYGEPANDTVPGALDHDSLG